MKIISLATTYEIDESFDDEKFLKLNLRICHDGKNPNGSFFNVEDFEKAEDSIYNIPILANVVEDEDGDLDFGGHDMSIEDHKMKEGETKLIYHEVPIGVVPEDCDYEIKEYNGKNYVFCSGYIWKNYSNYSLDIIERDKDIKLSMEILVDAYNYNAKEKVMNITDFRYQGITLLNKNYGTGMENALATTESFKIKDKFITMMAELKDTLANKNNEGGSTVNEELIALLAKYNITEDKLDFEIEGLSMEEVEEKLKGLSEPEKFIKSFELSHEDIRYALYNLLAPVEDADGEWYFIDQVFDDRFEYENWEGTKIYRQGYKKDGDIISFEGDRIELFQERLTKEEKDELDKIRDNYSLLETENKELKEVSAEYEEVKPELERLQGFEKDILAEQRKVAEEELFGNFEDKLKDNEEYEELKTNSEKYSIEELEKELALLYVKKTANFSLQKPNTSIKVNVNPIEDKKEDSRYGDLYERYLNK